jgi:hypothetical protein
MISQPKYNFVFVAVPKTGSSSMRARFKHCGCGPLDRDERTLYTGVPHRHPQHYRIREYRHILGDGLDSRFKFGFVRNPWDSLVSRYKMMCGGIHPRLARDGWHDPKRFQNWVSKSIGSNPEDPGFNWFAHELRPQLDWFTDENGDVVIDFIGRFENLSSDFEKVMERIHEIHPLPNKKFWKLPHKNSSRPSNHYSFYYNDVTVEIVRERYSKDIEEFGYTYEKGPGS